MKAPHDDLNNAIAYWLNLAAAEEKKTINKHGVQVYISSTGRFGHLDEKTGYFINHIPVQVPVICPTCRYFEREEHSEGETIAPPSCRKNIKFPTRKGTCKGFKANHD